MTNHSAGRRRVNWTDGTANKINYSSNHPTFHQADLSAGSQLLHRPVLQSLLFRLGHQSHRRGHHVRHRHDRRVGSLYWTARSGSSFPQRRKESRTYPVSKYLVSKQFTESTAVRYRFPTNKSNKAKRCTRAGAKQGCYLFPVQCVDPQQEGRALGGLVYQAQQADDAHIHEASRIQIEIIREVQIGANMNRDIEIT